MSVVEEIEAERRRQIENEGWLPIHDDTHTDAQLALAAGCYAIASSLAGERDRAFARYWPWNPSWFKSKGARRDLIRAGALIVAEIERLDRLALREEAA